MDELKPCPFCGGDAVFVCKTSYIEALNVGFAYTIECRDCHASPFSEHGEMNIFLYANGEIGMTDASIVKQKNMIDTWNRRTDNAE